MRGIGSRGLGRTPILLLCEGDGFGVSMCLNMHKAGSVYHYGSSTKARLRA